MHVKAIACQGLFHLPRPCTFTARIQHAEMHFNPDAVQPLVGKQWAKTVEHRCTASLGVTVFRPGESNADNILRRADDAMYRAKAKGSNQFRFGEDVVE